MVVYSDRADEVRRDIRKAAEQLERAREKAKQAARDYVTAIDAAAV